MTTRVMPPGAGSTVRVNKNVYTAIGGTTLDVPDADAQSLASAGWYIIGTVGSTTARPTAPSATIVPTAASHIDTTLGKPVFSDGAVWRDHTGKQV